LKPSSALHPATPVNDDNQDADKKINIYFKNHMTSDYKLKEHKLKEIIKCNVEPTDIATRIQVTIYYKTKKLRNLFIKNSCLPKKELTEENHVVYQYICNQGECNLTNKKYIGYTTMTLKERMIQHASIKKHHSIAHKRKIGYKEKKKIGRHYCYVSEYYAT
jgi:hypothetical protein